MKTRPIRLPAGYVQPDDGRGRLSLVVGAALLMLCGAAAVTIDYAAASASRAKLQAAADAATRAAVAHSGATDDFLGNISALYFNTRIKDDAELEVLKTGFEAGDEAYAFTAKAKVPTILLAVFGVRQLDIEVRSEVGRQPPPAR